MSSKLPIQFEWQGPTPTAYPDRVVVPISTPGIDGDDGAAGPQGPQGAAGPNLVSDATALGELTDAVADALFLLCSNAAGNAARKVAVTTFLRSLLQATPTAGRVLLAGAGPSVTDDAGLTFDPATNALGVGGPTTIQNSGGAANSDGAVTIRNNMGTRTGGFSFDGLADFVAGFYLNGSPVLIMVDSRPSVGNYHHRGLSVPGGDTGQDILLVSSLASHTARHLMLRMRSSTNAEREAASVKVEAVDNTDATRKRRAIFEVWDTAAREALRMEADGSAARLGFFGAAAAAKPTVTGSRGGNAALASMLTALAGLGLLTDSTTA